MSITEDGKLILQIDGETKLLTKFEISELFKTKKEPILTGDPIVDSVIRQFSDRSNFGQQKYKHTLESNKLGLKQWVQHVQEELMDAVNYLERIKSIL